MFRNDAHDTVEEIMDYIEVKFPSQNLHSDNLLAEAATRDFFSKFCFFIKVRKCTHSAHQPHNTLPSQAVSRDSSALDQSLSKLDRFLSRLPSSFLCGDAISHLDCEILPKLHHLRVAAWILKVLLHSKLFLSLLL